MVKDTCVCGRKIRKLSVLAIQRKNLWLCFEFVDLRAPCIQ
jgi:hypothetical protein